MAVFLNPTVPKCAIHAESWGEEKVGIIGHDDYNKKKLKWIHYSSKDQRRIDLKLVFISFCSNQLSLIFFVGSARRRRTDHEFLSRAASYLAPEVSKNDVLVVVEMKNPHKW